MKGSQRVKGVKETEYVLWRHIKEFWARKWKGTLLKTYSTQVSVNPPLESIVWI